MKSTARWIALLVLSLGGSTVQAQTIYTWNGGVAGAWSDGGAGWLDGATATNWSNATSLIASFTGTAPTAVVIDVGGVTAYGLNFSANGYVLSGGTLTLAAASGGATPGTITVNPGLTATINSAIAGSVGLFFNGGGTLILGGTSTYSGTTFIAQGTLQIQNAAALGSSSVALASSSTLALNHSGTTANAIDVSSPAPTIYTFGVTPTLTGNITNSEGAGGTLFLASNRGADGTHNLTFSGNSIALGLKAFAVTGANVDNEGDSENSKTTLNNVTLGTTSDVRVGRGTLQIQGSTSLTIDNQLQSGPGGDWARFVMGAGTSVVATGGVNMTANGVIASSLYLNGGTLTTPSITGNNFGGTTHVIFNGVTVKLSADNADFLRIQVNGNGNFQSGPGEIAGGFTFDSNGFNASFLTRLADLPGFNGGFTKTGAGTLTFGTANIHTGNTTVNSGTLQITAGATLGADNIRLFVNNGATLNLGGTTQIIGQTNDGGGGGAVGTITNGTLNLNGNNFFFESGTMDANLTGAGGSRVWLGGDPAATILLGGSNTVDFNDHHSTIIGHPVTGDVGIVRLTSTGALGPNDVAGNIIEAQLFTGTIDFNGQIGVAVGNLLLASGGNSKLVNTATTPASSVGTTQLSQNNTGIGGSGDITLNGVVFGGGGFNKTGAGTLSLPAANTYSGITIFSGGVVNAATFSDYGVAGSLGNRAADTGGEDMGLLFRGGTLQYTGNTPQSTNRMIRVSTDGGGGTIDASGSVPEATLTFNAATTLNFWENGGNRTLTLTGSNAGPNTFATVIPDIPGVTFSGVAKTGAGTWVLSGANTYRGQTNISNGILRITNSDSLGIGGFDGTTLTNVLAGGTLEIDGSLTIGEHFHFGGAGFGGLGAVRVLSGSSTSNTNSALDGNDATTVFNVLTGGSLALTAQLYTDATNSGLTKIGPGTLALNLAIYNGATNVNEGVLIINGSFANSSTVNVAAGAELQLNNTNALGIPGATVTAAGTVRLTAGIHQHFQLLTLNGGSVLTDTGSTAYDGLGNYALDNNVVAGGAAVSTLAANTGIHMNGNGTSPTFTVGTGSTLNVTGILRNDQDNNARGLVKQGQGDVILSGVNTYTGTTVVNEGALRIAGAGRLGAVGTAVSVNGGGTLDLGGTTQTVGQVNTAGNGGAVGTITNGTLDLNGNNMFFKSGTLDANLTGGGNSRLWLGGEATATILLGGVNTIDFGDHHSTIIGHPTTGAVGTVRLTSPTGLGPNNVAGNTIEAQLFDGTIDANGQTGITVGNLLLANGAASRLVNGNVTATASFLGTIVLSGAGTEVGGDGNINFQAAVSGAGGGIAKVGPGAIVYNSPATYGGTTTISAGTVRSGGTNTLPTGLMSLAGGTLSSGDTIGFSNALGTLQVTTGSIDLGTGPHTLNFAAFDASTFTGMTVFGWVGVGGTPGLEGKLVFTDLTAFTAPVLGAINFDGFNPGAMLVGNELVPVPIPEPALLLLAVAALPLLRRRGSVG